MNDAERIERLEKTIRGLTLERTQLKTYNEGLVAVLNWQADRVEQLEKPCATCALWYGRPVAEQLDWYAGMLGELHDYTPGQDNQLAILGAVKILNETIKDLEKRDEKKAGALPEETRLVCTRCGLSPGNFSERSPCSNKECKHAHGT
ncbi:MAG: hypothetical protein E4G89_00350 [Methanothrix sp.]|nr:MAG: hypothetical protein E4G89_00350 [Methanothrix sp.]